MTRTLKPGPRPFVAFSVMFGLLLVAPIGLGVSKGLWTDAGKLAACFLFLYAMLCGFVARLRIVVTPNSIAYRPVAGPEQVAQFPQIFISWARVLAEPDHPVSLEVFADSGSRTKEGAMILRPLLSAGLKAFRKEEVQWLLSLSELKVQRPEEPNSEGSAAPERAAGPRLNKPVPSKD